RKAPRAVRRERTRRGALVLAIQALVAEIREVDDAIRHREGPATVLVHARPHVPRWRRHVDRTTVGPPAHEDRPATLPRPPFAPEDRVAVHRERAQPRARDGDPRGRDRRPPGAEGRPRAHAGSPAVLSVPARFRIAALASSSQRSFSGWPSWPRTQCPRIRWICVRASSARHKSSFLTGLR